MRILNFGSLNLDYVYQVSHFVQPGETLSIDSLTVNPGGKGLNQSVALARAGAETCHAGCVGTGGGSLLEILQESGVDTAHIVPVRELQGNAVIQVDRNGENCILLFGGSNQCFTDRQVEETIDSFKEGDFLLLQNEINRLPLIVDCAGRKGLRIVLNPSPFNEKLKQVDFGKLDWLIVNEIEMEQLTGRKKPDQAWKHLHGCYPRLSLLVTLGSAGSVAYTENGTNVQEAVKVKAVDTTGAGDTYTGYFLAGLAEGRSIRECMRRGSIAAAIAVTRAGAACSIPTREEVDRFR